MTHGLKAGMALTAALCLISGGAMAQHEREHGRFSVPRAENRQAEPRQAEPHPGPMGYPRVAEPRGWNTRPGAVDRRAYQHNFQATRPYRIGPYHQPPGWENRRWGYGDTLPPAYWAAPYVLMDYWLFGLEIPPVGFEWVRVGADALLVNVTSGEVLQVVYGAFL